MKHKLIPVIFMLPLLFSMVFLNYPTRLSVLKKNILFILLVCNNVFMAILMKVDQ